jgi:phage-related protein
VGAKFCPLSIINLASRPNHNLFLAKNNFRLLGFEYEGSLVVLTNGFRKKDQKVPKPEIDLAQQRRKEYLANE